jgi:hypothetical protein
VAIGMPAHLQRERPVYWCVVRAQNLRSSSRHDPHHVTGPASRATSRRFAD